MLENFNIGWKLIILGMGSVFLILLMLSVILKVVGRYLSKQSQPTLGITSAPVQVATATVPDNKNAKIAAVMAAIQAVMGDTDYQVISIKPVEQSFWKQAVTVGPELKYQGRRGK